MYFRESTDITARLLVRNSATIWQCSKVLQLQARFRTLTRPLVLAPYIFHEENWMFLFLSAPSNVCAILSATFCLRPRGGLQHSENKRASRNLLLGPRSICMVSLSFICEWASVPQARGKWGKIPPSSFPYCCKCASHPYFDTNMAFGYDFI